MQDETVKEISKNVKAIEGDADLYASLHATDGVDKARLKNAYLAGANRGFREAADIHMEVTQRATSK